MGEPRRVYIGAAARPAVDGSEYRRMYFDTRVAKSLKPGGHLTVQGCPGLRLHARHADRCGALRAGSTTGLDAFVAAAAAEIELREGYEGEWVAASAACAAPMVPVP